MRQRAPRVTLGVRALLLLLRLYPPAFRREYGDDMACALQSHWTHVRARDGVSGVTRLVLRTCIDLMLGAPTEWHRAFRRHVRRTRRTRVISRNNGDTIMASIIQDVRLALRALVRQPSFTLIAVATLALGIGANTAIFSLVSSVLLEPLPYPQPDELVRVWSSNPAQGRDRYFTSPLAFYEWRERTTRFADMAAAWPREVTLSDDADTPSRLSAMSVTPNWFDVLGVNPQVGRLFTPADAGIAWGSWVVVLSDGLWRDRFGADPNVIGKVARIDGQSAEIVGVLPPATGFPETADLFTNFLPPRTQSAQYLDVIARMTHDTSVPLASSELAAIAAGLAEEFPTSLSGSGIDVAPLYDVVVGDVRPALLMLLAATVLVLAIACANVANLLLTRTENG